MTIISVDGTRVQGAYAAVLLNPDLLGELIKFSYLFQLDAVCNQIQQARSSRISISVSPKANRAFVHSGTLKQLNSPVQNPETQVLLTAHIRKYHEALLEELGTYPYKLALKLAFWTVSRIPDFF